MSMCSLPITFTGQPIIANKPFSAEDVKFPAVRGFSMKFTIAQVGTIHIKKTTQKYTPYEISRARLKVEAAVAPKLRSALPALRRAICIHAGGLDAQSSQLRKSCLVSSRRNFPLEVFGMLPRGSSSTR